MVCVHLAPSYITADAAAVRPLLDFFTAPTFQQQQQQLQPGGGSGGGSGSSGMAGAGGALAAQAAAQAQQLQREAARRLAGLSQERPRLKLSVVLHAPKVAVPDGKVRLC